jgi:hypothetical protein
MVTVIKKEDLVSAIKSVPTPSAVPTSNIDKAINILNQVDTILKNEFVQNIILRFASRFGISTEPKSPLSSVTSTVSTDGITSEKIYDTILSQISSILTIAGDIPLSQVKKYMADNKSTVVQMIKDAGFK